MHYWWVNQNQTYKTEVPGGFLWSPKANKDGGRNHFYDTMARVEAGDIIFSFCDTEIKAVGIANGAAQSAEKPNFGSVGDQWANDGWLVPVEFTESRSTIPVRPKDFIGELLPFLPQKYSPLQANGNGNQGVYLAEISEGFAERIFEKLGLRPSDFKGVPELVEDVEADKVQGAIEGRTDIGPTQKQQLVLSRRGQGIFKANVRLNERACRVTGIIDPRLLIASHIKPWSKSSDKEKLDGCNGLLLSPHVDCLFDKGLISFEDGGAIVLSPKLDRSVLRGWALDRISNVGPFKPEQCAYLNYHRAEILKS
jgi:putative restriction endonuclease